jgi:uncharacterized protein (DUF2236 family)
MNIVERVNAERVVLLGWSRAILMQLAHPLIATGVVQHSTFRGGAIEAAVRLHHTVGAMLSLVFGDDAGRAAAVARIRAIHRTINGTLPEAAGPFAAGTRYSAEDPALLLWVHATLVDSSADIYQRIIGPLGASELDDLCVLSAPLLAELGGDPASTPLRWSDLQNYMSSVHASGALTVTPDARMIGVAVLSPRAAGVPLPLAGFHRLIATGLLPPSLREAYGIPWSPQHDIRFGRALNLVRNLRRVAPSFVARWPHARHRA